MHDPRENDWHQERSIEGAGFPLCLPGLMMASTCCFMVTAGVVQLPFGPKYAISLLPHSSLPSFLPFSSVLYSLLICCISRILAVAISDPSPSPSLHPPPYLAALFHFAFPSLWLIALMFFLWSTATSSSSVLVWPHVFQEGMRRCGGEGPQGTHTARHQNNMSHSCLMTSTIQPCRALTVHLHPKGSCNMKVIHLFHTAKKIPTLLLHDSHIQ